MNGGLIDSDSAVSDKLSKIAKDYITKIMESNKERFKGMELCEVVCSKHENIYPDEANMDVLFKVKTNNGYGYRILDLEYVLNCNTGDPDDEIDSSLVTYGGTFYYGFSDYNSFKEPVMSDYELYLSDEVGIEPDKNDLTLFDMDQLVLMSMDGSGRVWSLGKQI